jgi:hypothetical protein
MKGNQIAFHVSDLGDAGACAERSTTKEAQRACTLACMTQDKDAARYWLVGFWNMGKESIIHLCERTSWTEAEVGKTWTVRGVALI